ncbi:MAG: MFS transporter [Rhodospirillaceae bacterium]|nr:MFS transporter [Rhodospirillaceae bacterium]
MDQLTPSSPLSGAAPAPQRGLSRLQLALSSALAPFAMVVAAPLLPEMARAFQADAAGIQYVISAYLFGLFVAQLVLGPISDRFGRRVVLIGGLVVYAITSIKCAMAPTLGFLVAARFLQACGAAAVATAVRASVHDVHHGDEAARRMAFIAVGHSVAHSLSPMIGGLAGEAMGYAGIFFLLAGLGVALLAWSVAAFPETRPRRASAPGRFGLGHALVTSLAVLRSPLFLAYTAIYGLTGAGFFAFLAVGPEYFARNFAVSGAAFGLYWSYMALAFLVGAAAGARAVRRFGRRAAFNVCLAAGAAVGVALPTLIALVGPSPLVIIAPMVLLSGLLGVSSPLALSGAVGAHPTMAGTASGLCGALAMALSGVFTIVGGVFYTGGVYALVLPLTTTSLLMLACAGAIARLERLKPPAPSPPPSDCGR